MKIHNTKFTKHSKIYIKKGYYDEGGQYNEEPFDKVALRDFPRDVRRELITNLNKGYQCNALVFPEVRTIFVLVPEEHKDKVEQQIEDDEVKLLLDYNADCDVPHGYLLWAHRNFPKE